MFTSSLSLAESLDREARTVGAVSVTPGETAEAYGAGRGHVGAKDSGAQCAGLGFAGAFADVYLRQGRPGAVLAPLLHAEHVRTGAAIGIHIHGQHIAVRRLRRGHGDRDPRGTAADRAEAGPDPAVFDARTVKVKALPLVNRVTVHDVARVLVQVFPPGDAVTVYLVIGELPLEEGADHDTAAEALPGTAFTALGAAGTEGLPSER